MLSSRGCLKSPELKSNQSNQLYLFEKVVIHFSLVSRQTNKVLNKSNVAKIIFDVNVTQKFIHILWEEKNGTDT